MAMKAAEIRESLQQLAVFAPALLAAAEIVETAEIAEAKIKELNKAQITLQANLDEFKVKADSYEKQYLDARSKYHNEMDVLEKNRLESRNSLSEVQRRRDEAIAEMEAAKVELKKHLASVDSQVGAYRKEKEKVLADLDMQIDDKRRTLAQEQRRLDEFRRSLGSVAVAP